MTGNNVQKHVLGKPAEPASGDLTPEHRYERNCDMARKKMEALSSAEIQVLRGIMTGSSDKAIACHLELDLADVQGHHSSVMVKFGAKSTADAVRTAIYAGLQANAITCVRE